jgi:hypothetical protein
MKAGKTWVAVAALAVALISLFVAPAAGKPHKKALPKAPKTFFGVVPLEDPTPADLSKMSGGGVDSIRLLLRWVVAEQVPGVYDWSQYDAEIGNSAAAGLIPHVQFTSSPSWVSSNPNQPPVYSDGQKTAWSNFLTAFTQRYGRGGAFWRDHPGIPSRPVTSFEIWNEPNLNNEWGGPPNPSDYLTLLQISQAAIKKVDPGARIVFGGLFPFPPPDFGVKAGWFLRAFLGLPGAGSSFDVLALHPYSPSAAAVVPTCRKFRNILNGQGRRAPLWITEMGWSTSGVGWLGSPYRATERQQAVKLTRSFTDLIRARRALRLQRVFWHDWRDSADQNTDWIFQMGLLRADGSAKPSWKAYRRLARR